MVALGLTVLIVLAGSAFCSGSETALLSITHARASALTRGGTRPAAALLAIQENLARPIAAIVVLNNVFNIVGAIAVGTIAANQFGHTWVGVISGVLTFLVILFAEILPKTIAERHAETVALTIAIPVQILTVVLTPVVALLELAMRPVTRGPRPPSTSEAEIGILAQMGHSEGVLEEDEMEMIQRVFHLNDRSAGQLMTPRSAVTWLDVNAPISTVRTDILASEHTRIVLANATLDDVVGVALKHELLAALLDQPDTTVGSCRRPVIEVPRDRRADDLLEIFRARREHLALVTNEEGAMVGVVTLEDVIEVLTGPIVDETDRRTDLRAYARARARARATRWS